MQVDEVLLLLERLNVNDLTVLFFFYLLYQPGLLHLYHASVLSILQYTLVCGAFCHLFFCTSNTEQHLGRVIYVQSSILESHQPAAHIKLFLSFICYSVLSILQYISVWCLLSSTLLVQSSILEESFMCRAVYCNHHQPATHIKIFLSFICSTCNNINLQSTLHYCMLHLIQDVNKDHCFIYHSIARCLFFSAHRCGVFYHLFFCLPTLSGILG